MSIIEEAKKVFLEGDDVDEELYQQNLDAIAEWEAELLEKEALAEWQEQDVTQLILKKVKYEYTEAAYQLAQNRNLNEQERMSLFSRKDACSLMIELMGSNAADELKQLNREIKRKISLFDI